MNLQLLNSYLANNTFLPFKLPYEIAEKGIKNLLSRVI